MSILLVSCAGQAASAQAGEPAFRITTKNSEDQIDIYYEGDVAVFDVYSPSGIGAATIQLETGLMPEQIFLRLHLTGLETLRVTSSENGIQASVASGDPSQINIQEVGSEAPILPFHPMWMKVEIAPAGTEKKIPLEEGYFEITLPGEFIRQAGDMFDIEWIDFYR